MTGKRDWILEPGDRNGNEMRSRGIRSPVSGELSAALLVILMAREPRGASNSGSPAWARIWYWAILASFSIRKSSVSSLPAIRLRTKPFEHLFVGHRPSSAILFFERTPAMACDQAARPWRKPAPKCVQQPTEMRFLFVQPASRAEQCPRGVVRASLSIATCTIYNQTAWPFHGGLYGAFICNFSEMIPGGIQRRSSGIPPPDRRNSCRSTQEMSLPWASSFSVNFMHFSCMT